MNFEPHECVIFVQSTKIGTHEYKGIHSIPCDEPFQLALSWLSPIHSPLLEISEVSSETDMLLISVWQQTDAAIFW